MTVVNLIGNTTTKKWLRIKARLDEREYEKWIKVSEEDLASINIERDEFHWEWNYSIAPQND